MCGQALEVGSLHFNCSCILFNLTKYIFIQELFIKSQCDPNF